MPFKNHRKFRGYWKSRIGISSIVEGDQIVFDDLDKVEKFKDYFSSVYEDDNGKESICKHKSLSVLETNVFDVTSIVNLFDSSDDMYTLPPDGAVLVFY